jgi:nanoRNase/pAp phosphatase (c-di-AMP/oligoRNAs hydrolase)
VWNYLWSKEFTMPDCVELLSLYDNWQWKDHERALDIMNFQMGMRNQNTSIHEEFFWAKMLHTNHLIEEMIISGKEIQKYQASQNARLANANSFVTELDSIKCLAINASGGIEVFDSIIDQHKDCEAMILFQVRKNGWSVSMRSETIDVGSICKAHGGGGHRGAAGFVCQELPFKLAF